jgi:septal ring factor EnvC (AmiA/AmiB activator)
MELSPAHPPQKRKASFHDISDEALFVRYQAITTEINQRIEAKERELAILHLPVMTFDERASIAESEEKIRYHQEAIQQEEQRKQQIVDNFNTRCSVVTQKRESLVREVQELRAKFNK